MYRHPYDRSCSSCLALGLADLKLAASQEKICRKLSVKLVLRPTPGRQLPQAGEAEM